MSARRDIVPSPLGSMLREWRALRGMSQLGLGLAAGVSSRHISFIETGRSRPSRGMVLNLADALDMPLRSRNSLLERAGFAQVYGNKPLDHPDMAGARRAIDLVLKAHEPCAAFALDPCWNVLEANPPAAKLLAIVGRDANEPGLNLARLVMEDEAMMELIDNWQELSHHMLLRLQVETRGGPLAETAQELLDALRANPRVAALETPPDLEPEPLIPLKFRLGDDVLSFITVISTIGSAKDVGLSELRIETFVPADEKTEAMAAELLG